MQQIPELLRGAVGFHQRGKLADAEKLYNEVLAIDAKQFDALHLLGLLKHQRGDSDQAIRLIAAALDVNPKSPPALLNYGGVLCLMGRYADALACYDRILEIDPDQLDAIYNRGNALMGLDRYAEALEAYEQSLALKPDNPLGHFNRGNALVALERAEEALAAFDRALQFAPKFTDALVNRGRALSSLGREAEALACFEKAAAAGASGAGSNKRAAALLHLNRYQEALECCERQLAANPDDVEALDICGKALRGLNLNKKALTYFDRLLKLRPGDPATINNRAITLVALSRYDEALTCFDEMLARNPNDAAALNNRGLALVGLNRLEEALVCYDKVLTQMPDNVEALNNRGNALKSLNRYDEAVTCLERAIAKQPDHAESHWNAGACRLALGDMAKGWKDYEWRWKTPDFPTEPPKLRQPLWNGERVSGGLLVWGEQGLGDQVIYASMVPDLANHADSVILAVGRRLGPLFTRSFPDVHVIARNDAPLQSFAAHSSLGSLGQYLRPTLESFPRREQGYLVADAERAASLRRRLSPSGETAIGLSWISKNPSDAAVSKVKSARLRDFEPILRLPDCRFVDLQYGDTLAERVALQQETELVVRRLEEIDNTNDLDALAALITACDLVVTVSNTTAHLAGALGKPTIVLVPFGRPRFWYWFKEGIRCPWYPKVGILYQGKDESWPELIGRAAERVAAFAKGERDLFPAESRN